MAQFRTRDNTRESFTGANSTTITLGGAAQYSRSFAGAGFGAGDTFFGTARGGAEICVGLFTYNTTTIAQTTPKYSSNSNAAVTFSSGNACEVFNDVPAYVLELLNLTEISVNSATTCDIGGTAVEGAKVLISGTTTITSFGTGIDKLRFVRFSGALTLTHNATSLILPGAANITTIAGDTAVFMSDSSGNWRCYDYKSATYAPFSGKLIKDTIFTASGTWTKSAGCHSVVVEVKGGGGGGGGVSSVATNAAAGGGGEGGSCIKRITAPGATETVTIGAGGTAGANTGGTGGTGGTSSFGSWCSATGGVGGSGATAAGVSQAGDGGAGASGDMNFNGQGGTVGVGIAGSFEFSGSGGGRGGSRNYVGSFGGFGGNQGGGGAGAGSSGSAANAGGVGGPGYVIVWEYE